MTSWDRMFTAGLRTHLCASRLAIPLMDRGFLVSTIAWAGDLYLAHLFYDVVKHATVRMVFGMMKELRAHEKPIAAIALAPGFVRTERVMAHFGDQRPPGSESPEYIGRAVARLAADPEILEQSGRVLQVGDLARAYGFGDVDGSQPKPWRMPKSARWYWRLFGDERNSSG